MVSKVAAVEPPQLLIVQAENAQIEFDGPASSITVSHEPECHEGVQEALGDSDEGGRCVDDWGGTQAGELKKPCAMPEPVVAGRRKPLIVGEVVVYLDVADQAPVRAKGLQSEMPLVDAKDVKVVVDPCIWRCTASERTW